MLVGDESREVEQEALIAEKLEYEPLRHLVPALGQLEENLHAQCHVLLELEYGGRDEKAIGKPDRKIVSQGPRRPS